MSNDYSAGGGGDAWQAPRQQFGRMFTAANVPLVCVDNGYPGETGYQILQRWLGRTQSYKYTTFAVGRNGPGNGGPSLSDPACIAVLQAQVFSIIANARPGQVLIFESVHNYNESAASSSVQGEYPGGSHEATYTNILAFNAWLASIANGTSILYLDSRAEALLCGIIGNATDAADVARDQPPRSLTADGLHRNGAGSEVRCRNLFAVLYTHWLIANPRTNLVSNGKFDVNATGWNAGGGSTLTVSNGVVSVSAGNNYRGINQQTVASGATGKTYLIMWDWPALAGKVQLLARLNANSGGGNYASPPGWASLLSYSSLGLPFEQVNKRAGRKFLTFVACTDTSLGLSFEAVNDATGLFSLDNVMVHRVT